MNTYIKTAAAVTAIIFASTICCSCNSGTQEETAPNVSREITLSGLGEDHWTYFSIETGEVVGTSIFLSSEEDLAWSKRRDWDFAICGDYLKTNSGTSGEGMGGVQKDGTSNFLTLKEAPADGYLIDEMGIIK